MRAWRTGGLVLALLACTPFAKGQGGVRFILGDYLFGYGELRTRGVGYGLGYDHDLNSRLAWGVDLSYLTTGTTRVGDHRIEMGGLDALELIYRASYMTSNNTRSAFYAGSWVGVRRYAYSEPFTDASGERRHRDANALSVPLGLRMGVRGGLEGLYGDLYLAMGCRLGGTVYTALSDQAAVRSTALSGAELRVGLALGFGWEGRRR